MKAAIVAMPLVLALLSCSPAADRATDNQSTTALATSGKSTVPLTNLPPEVTSAVKSAQPDLTISSAEAETRDSRRYFDVGGTLPDGSEIEFDVMEEDGTWRVVETQRDIAFSAAPQLVRIAAREADPSFEPTRVIESRQQDNLVIYELYGPAGGNPQGRKVEIKWDGRAASLLTKEWAH